ncbi:unnamed protein product, partial [Clonostachys rosea]
RDCFMPSIPLTSCDITNGTCTCIGMSEPKLFAGRYFKYAPNSFQTLLSTANSLFLTSSEATLRLEADGCHREKRSRKWSLLIPLVFEVPAWFFIWIRLYSRWSLLGRWDLDDWLMFPVGAFYTVSTVFSHYGGHMAYGVDMWTLEAHQVTQSSKYFYISDLFYLVAIALTKISMLWFYLRIFPPNKHFRFLVYTSIAFTAIPTTALVFLNILKCIPVHSVWDGWMNPSSPARYFNSQILKYVSSGLNIVQDLIIFLLPMGSLLRLKMDNRSKWGISLMFGLGILILVTSCVRLKYITSYGTANNASWEYTDTIIWTGLELSVVIIVACLPAIWLLVKRILPSAVSRNRSGYIRQTSGGKQRIDKRRIFFGTKKVEKQDNESEVELGLDLGDRRGGRVRTHISTHRRSFDDYRVGNGIRVDTVLTTLVTMSRIDSFDGKGVMG